MDRKDQGMLEVYEPVFQFSTIEEYEAHMAAESAEGAQGPSSEDAAEEALVQAGVTELSSADGAKVILVQQQYRDTSYTTPTNQLKRLLRHARSFVGFVISAILISLAASVILNEIL